MVATNETKQLNVVQLHENRSKLAEAAKIVVALCPEGFSEWTVVNGMATGAIIGSERGGMLGAAVPPSDLLKTIDQLKSKIDARYEMLKKHEGKVPPQDAVEYIHTRCSELFELELVNRACKFLQELNLWVDKWALG